MHRLKHEETRDLENDQSAHFFDDCILLNLD